MGKNSSPPPAPDHGPQVQIDEKWNTIWPNLLNFVGPKQNREDIKKLVDTAISCFLNEQHYQVMLYFNQALCKLEEFPSEPSTPANNSNNQKPEQQQQQEQQEKKQQEQEQESSLSSSSNEAPTATELGHRAALDFIINSKEYQASFKKAQLGDSLLNEARSDNDTWKNVSKEKNGDGVWYREEKDTGIHSFKIVGTLEKTPMLDLACLLLELDLFKEWFPMCFRSKQTGAISRYERCATFEVTCPWPMSNREAVLWGFAIDDLEATRRCLIVAKDHSEKVGHVEVPETPKGVVRLGVNQCGYILEAVNPTTTRVIFIGNIDPKMNLPEWLLNWATQKFCGVLMWQMHRGAKAAKNDPKSPYAERKKHEIYDEFKKRVAAMNYEKDFNEMVEENKMKHATSKPKKLQPLEKSSSDTEGKTNNTNTASASASSSSQQQPTSKAMQKQS